MNLPDHVQVGPFRFTVVAGPHVTVNNMAGHMKPLQQQLVVDTSAGSDQIADTLLHETLHAIWYAAGNRTDKVDNETAVVTLASGLLDTLRRNPQLVDYLCHPETTP